MLGQEPYFTNYTAQFKGTLDYIMYNPQVRLSPPNHNPNPNLTLT